MAARKCCLTDDKRDLVSKELTDLIKQIEGEEHCFPSSGKVDKVPDYLTGPKRPRYVPDWTIYPFITSVPIAEVRPTNCIQHYRETMPRIGRAWFNGPDTTHKYKPWDRPIRAKSIEIRSGVVYDFCECFKTNGLQDQCTRTGCGGSTACLQPEPACLPAQLIIPMTPSTDRNAAIKAAFDRMLNIKREICCCKHPEPRRVAW